MNADWLFGLDAHWHWMAFGLLLALAEMIAPGVFLIWLGGAAFITGLVTLLLPIGLPLQVVIFAALSVASIFVGRNYIRRNPIIEADPLMNRRGARIVGEVGTVVQAIDTGNGRIRLGDTEWLASGPELPVGTKVRVCGSNGAVLAVEPLDAVNVTTEPVLSDESAPPQPD